ncbi:MAG: YciI family protein [Parvularculaceae bacterium]|nr:YciI family protein [Parvularculaceae bacterium]
MKAMILAYESPGDFAMRTDKAAFESYMAPWFAYAKAMNEAGVNRSGAPLLGPETATVVSISNGRRQVEDGPFADTKEQLGGYFIIEVADLDEAARWGAKCPAAKSGRVDVRAIPDYGQGN